MFESIVNLISSAALPNSVPREEVAAPASKMMTRRTRASLDSTVAPITTTAAATTDSDQGAFDHAHAHDHIGVDFSGPLPTPEASRSETSSNFDLVPGDENPPTRRKSARVTRMSLRALENLQETEEDSKVKDVEASSIDVKNRTVSGETLINSIVESRASRSSLKNDTSTTAHSWSQTTLLRDGMETDENTHLATPDSKRSEESEELPRRRSLRARPAKEEQNEEQKSKNSMEEATTPVDKPEKSAPPRRSSRLSLVTRATEVLDRAASVLGKRSRDAMEKAVLKRRASLRPRHSLPANESSVAISSGSQLPDPKKRRVSDGDLLLKKKQLDAEAEKADESEKAAKVTPAAPQFKPKRWLEQGLYTGQTRDYNPRLNEANNKIRAAKRKAPVEAQRKLLPLPMFAGERLLKNGRDFKLPFDIFSPLPPGQPKPDEWKKTNRSKLSACVAMLRYLN